MTSLTKPPVAEKMSGVKEARSGSPLHVYTEIKLAAGWERVDQLNARYAN